MSTTEKYIGESQIKETPKKKIGFQLGDRVVKHSNIANKAVGLEHLDDSARTFIASITVGGIALANDLGENELIGINQKKLTEVINDLQDQINVLAIGDTGLTFAIYPDLVFVGEEETITLTATSNLSADGISINKDSTELSSGSGLYLECEDTIEPDSAGNINYTANFTINGVHKTINAHVKAVYPILYGAGETYDEADTAASIRETPAGTYTIVVENNEDYVFFNIPSTMTINEAVMNNFAFPLEEPEMITIDGISYKSYQSSNTYDAGSLIIQII